MPDQAASDAARALIRHRWDRITDPAQRTKETAPMVAAHVAKARRRHADRAIEDLLVAIED